MKMLKEKEDKRKKQLKIIRDKIKHEEDKQREITTGVVLNLNKINGGKQKGRNESLIPANLKLKLKTKINSHYSNILGSKRVNKNGKINKITN